MSEPEVPAVAASGAVNGKSEPLTARSVKTLVLPESLISSVDLHRTMRELLALDDLLHQADVRAPGVPVNLGRSSQVLEDLTTANGVSLPDAPQRGELLEAMKSLTNNAPVIHMSFAVEPSAIVSSRIIIWLRQNIDPLVLLEIGLQPLLAVGCMLRTNNKMFDMSLRHRFQEQRHILREKIAEQSDGPASVVTAVSSSSNEVTPS